VVSVEIGWQLGGYEAPTEIFFLSEAQMSYSEPALFDWFKVVVTVLRREDLFLRNYLQPYSSGAYEKWAPGIIGLYETGIVYLLLRELWCLGYPRALGWEHPFPGYNAAHIDLAIFHQRPEERLSPIFSPEHVIEVKKKWIGGISAQQLAVWSDLLKVLSVETTDHRHVLLLSFGPEGALLEKDVDDLLSMRLGGNQQQYTLEQLVSEVITKEDDRQYYLQHFDHVREILWDEFGTRLDGNKPGLVRVSLIEIFRRTNVPPARG
jgi:hypothetical protein